MKCEVEKLELDLELPHPTTQAFHFDSLQKFNDILYNDILTIGNITSKEQIYSFKDAGTLTGFRLEKKNDRKIYFLKTDDINKLPLKVTKTKKDSFRTDVMYIIKEAKSVKIPDVKETSFRNVVDWLCNFKHSNPIHWKLYKIITIVGAIDRVNYRAIGDAGFGKDSVVDALTELINETANIYGATFAKLEYHLKNTFLFFNEMGNLNKDDKFNMQNFFLQSAAFRNKYIKKSRKSKGTREEYNLSKTSVGIASNPYLYYKQKGQETFIDMFQQAVIDRFIPFRFNGVLTHKFLPHFNTKNVVSKNQRFYKKIISTLNWYRNNTNKVEPIDWDYNPEFKFKIRYDRTFNVIIKYISIYAENKEEYVKLVDELHKCCNQAKEEEKVYMSDEGYTKVVEENPFEQYEEEFIEDGNSKN